MKKVMKKVIVLTLVCAMLISNFTACGKKEETVTLTIYSQLANFSGEQMGWSAKILKDNCTYYFKNSIITDSKSKLVVV